MTNDQMSMTKSQWAQVSPLVIGSLDIGHSLKKSPCPFALSAIAVAVEAF